MHSLNQLHKYRHRGGQKATLVKGQYPCTITHTVEFVLDFVGKLGDQEFFAVLLLNCRDAAAIS